MRTNHLTDVELARDILSRNPVVLSLKTNDEGDVTFICTVEADTNAYGVYGAVQPARDAPCARGERHYEDVHYNLRKYIANRMVCAYHLDCNMNALKQTARHNGLRWVYPYIGFDISELYAEYNAKWDYTTRDFKKYSLAVVAKREGLCTRLEEAHTVLQLIRKIAGENK